MFFPAKPVGVLVLPDADYPTRVKFWPSLAQLQCCVTRLCPHKAPGEDGIPNVVIKESLKLIAEYLLRIYKATFILGMYSDRWRIWDTIVLCKPGKPRYDIPKAHWMIALMNTMGKLLSSMVTEDLVYMCK